MCVHLNMSLAIVISDTSNFCKALALFTLMSKYQKKAFSKLYQTQKHSALTALMHLQKHLQKLSIMVQIMVDFPLSL